MRFNRAAVFVFAGLIASLGSAAFAQNFVKPGDTVSIPLPTENAADSGETIDSVKVVVTGPSAFVTNPTDSATESLTPGQTKTLTASFIVGTAAEEGQVYEVRLKTVTPDLGVDPDPDDATTDTSVRFTVNNTAPADCPDRGPSRTLQPRQVSLQKAVRQAQIFPKCPMAGAIRPLGTTLRPQRLIVKTCRRPRVDFHSHLTRSTPEFAPPTSGS